MDGEHYKLLPCENETVENKQEDNQINNNEEEKIEEKEEISK